MAEILNLDASKIGPCYITPAQLKRKTMTNPITESARGVIYVLGIIIAALATLAGPAGDLLNWTGQQTAFALSASGVVGLLCSTLARANLAEPPTGPTLNADKLSSIGTAKITSAKLSAPTINAASTIPATLTTPDPEITPVDDTGDDEITQTDNGWHDGDPIDQPDQNPVYEGTEE